MHNHSTHLSTHLQPRTASTTLARTLPLCGLALVSLLTATRSGAQGPSRTRGEELIYTGSHALGVATLEQECASKVQRGCVVLAQVLIEGRPTLRVDSVRAASLYNAACDAGEPTGCHGVAVTRYHGIGGVEKDEGGAKAQLARYCANGVGISCGVLGRFVSDAGRLEDGAPYYERGCTLGDPRSCNNLGFVRFKVPSLQADIAEIRRAFGDACDQLYGDGCNNLAQLRLGADRTQPPDTSLALSLLARSCFAFNAEGCKQLDGLLEGFWYGVFPASPLLKSIGIRYTNARGYCRDLVNRATGAEGRMRLSEGARLSAITVCSLARIPSIVPSGLPLASLPQRYRAMLLRAGQIASAESLK